MPDRTLNKRIRTLAMVLVVVVSIVLIATAFAMLVRYTNEVSEQSASKASYHTLAAAQNVISAIQDTEVKSIIVAHDLADLQTREEVYDYFFNLTRRPGFEDVLLCRYFKDGVLYSSLGEEYTGYDAAREYYASTPEQAGCIGIFDDSSTVSGLMSVIGFYSPVEESGLADAVVVYYTRSKIETFFPEDKRAAESEFSLLCTLEGEIVAGREMVDSSHVLTLLRNRIGDKTTVDKLEAMMRGAESGTVTAKVGGNDYIISVYADRQTMSNLCVVDYYSVEVLSASSFEFINSIIAIFVVFALIALGVLLYFSVRHSLMKRELLNQETVNRQMDCLNRNGFENEVTQILERNRNSYFAVIVCSLRHFKHIQETCGTEETQHLLSYLRAISSRTTRVEETYGYLDEGDFLLLLHARDRQDLIERLKIHASLATRYKGAHVFDVILKYGIYEVEQDTAVSAVNMVDFAIEANNSIVRATVQNASMQFNFYSSELRKIRMLNEDMELRMEGALQNGEFQVFYQPKYNLNIDRQDGCEALVRWYDKTTNEYNRPALFMPLFESNGFIIKLDKYVYMKVCEYINYSVAEGRTVYPVSVNVSRITAVQPDFIEYYSSVKKKYGIRDGQIMIEFTESFAYENHETLASIVNDLHRNGFKCSIDDFGSGYSSYMILKFLPMDEIKLDKFFIEKGLSRDRDFHIIESIISVAKKLGMKVTQEGVEEYEDIKRLRALGCDVVQGYYYSKPMPLTDYISFCATSREHNIPKDENEPMYTPV